MLSYLSTCMFVYARSGRAEGRVGHCTAFVLRLCLSSVVKTKLQITNMASMQRSFYLLHARVIRPIFLPN